MGTHLKRTPKIGDVYIMEFYGKGSAQSGVRPGIVVQNNVGNLNSPNIVAIPLTSVMKNLYQPTHVLLPAKETGLQKDSIALCECPTSVPKNNIGKFLITIPERYMQKIAKAFLLQHPVLCFLNTNDVFSIQREAYSLIAD